jgi:tRNA(Arg) A34 adenosine deaminase TadA
MSIPEKPILQLYDINYKSGRETLSMATVRYKGEEIILDKKPMRKAIDAALIGIKKGSGPFGAAIVDFEGKVISCTANSVVKSRNPTLHAEVNAIIMACKKLRTHVLDRHIIYTTTEPCLMCRGAIYWAQIPVIVYGTNQKDVKILGFDEINISDAQFQRIGKRRMVIVKDFMRADAKKIFREFRKMQGKMY